MLRIYAFRERLLRRALALEAHSAWAAVIVQTLVGCSLWLKLLPAAPARPKAPLTLTSLALAAALLLVGLVWVVGPLLGQTMTLARENNITSGHWLAALSAVLLLWARSSGKRYLAAMRTREAAE